MYQLLPHMRTETAYPDNGSATSGPVGAGWGNGSASLAQKPRRKDIGETGIDAEVHGMASANNMVSPIANWRPEEPYAANGSAETGPVGAGWGDGTLAAAQQRARFAQQPRRKDIGEGNLDPEVHGMASANNMVSPIPNWRPDSPYDSNGSAETGPVGPGWGDGTVAAAQRSHQGVRFVQEYSSPEGPYALTRHLHKQRQIERPVPSLAKDINIKEVCPDVYTTVRNNVDPVMMPRSKWAPLVFEHPWDEAEHLAKLKKINQMNYWDREDAKLKLIREKIEKQEEAAEAKKAAQNPEAFEADQDLADAIHDAKLGLPPKDAAEMKKMLEAGLEPPAPVEEAAEPTGPLPEVDYGDEDYDYDDDEEEEPEEKPGDDVAPKAEKGTDDAPNVDDIDPRKI